MIIVLVNYTKIIKITIFDFLSYLVYNKKKNKFSIFFDWRNFYEGQYGNQAGGGKSRVKLWWIADKLGIADTGLSKKLRHELPDEEKEKIRAIIAELAKEV